MNIEAASNLDLLSRKIQSGMALHAVINMLLGIPESHIKLESRLGFASISRFGILCILEGIRSCFKHLDSCYPEERSRLSSHSFGSVQTQQIVFGRSFSLSNN